MGQLHISLWLKRGLNIETVCTGISKPFDSQHGAHCARTPAALVKLKANFERRQVLKMASRWGPGWYSDIFLNQTFVISETPKVFRTSLIQQGEVISRCPSLTAVVQPVQLQHIIVTEVHLLANHIFKIRDLCDNGGLCSVLESCLSVVHDRGVVIGYIQGIGHTVTEHVEIVFSAWIYFNKLFYVHKMKLLLLNSLNREIENIIEQTLCTLSPERHVFQTPLSLDPLSCTVVIATVKLTTWHFQSSQKSNFYRLLLERKVLWNCGNIQSHRLAMLMV